MGVWIETPLDKITVDVWLVTPFVGVWIETRPLDEIPIDIAVTPFVGVWIETSAHDEQPSGGYRHTLRGCVD